MYWGAPGMLPLLLGLPLIGLSMWMGLRRRNKRLASVITPELQPLLLTHLSRRRIYLKKGLKLLSLSLLLIAMARPQWGTSLEKVEERSLEIIIALDTSKSMLASDFKPTRLQQAKWGIQDLIRTLRSDRLGLIAFSGSAFLQCPPTSDYAAFDMMLEDLYAGIIPVGGTDLSAALRCALESFPADEQTHADRVIILISDGETHTGDALDYIEPLQQAGVRLFAVGVGTPDGELIHTDKGFVKNRAGEIVKSRLMESELETLAHETGGFYLRATPGNLGLERIYESGIAPLQRSLREEEWREVRTERFPLFLGSALVVLFIEKLITPRIKEPSS